MSYYRPLAAAPPPPSSSSGMRDAPLPPFPPLMHATHPHLTTHQMSPAESSPASLSPSVQLQAHLLQDAHLYAHEGTLAMPQPTSIAPVPQSMMLYPTGAPLSVSPMSESVPLYPMPPVLPSVPVSETMLLPLSCASQGMAPTRQQSHAASQPHVAQPLPSSSAPSPIAALPVQAALRVAPRTMPRSAPPQLPPPPQSPAAPPPAVLAAAQLEIDSISSGANTPLSPSDQFADVSLHELLNDINPAVVSEMQANAPQVLKLLLEGDPTPAQQPAHIRNSAQKMPLSNTPALNSAVIDSIALATPSAPASIAAKPSSAVTCAPPQSDTPSFLPTSVPPLGTVLPLPYNAHAPMATRPVPAPPPPVVNRKSGGRRPRSPSSSMRATTLRRAAPNSAPPSLGANGNIGLVPTEAPQRTSSGTKGTTNRPRRPRSTLKRPKSLSGAFNTTAAAGRTARNTKMLPRASPRVKREVTMVSPASAAMNASAGAVISVAAAHAATAAAAAGLRASEKAEEEARKAMRAERNRHSAAASRERRKDQIQELERRVAGLSRRNAELQVEQMDAVRRIIQRERELLNENNKLKRQVVEQDMVISRLAMQLEEVGLSADDSHLRRRRVLTRPKSWSISDWGGVRPGQ